MPVIVMCSTKGGVGKSTTALTLASVYAKAGQPVTLIDADPNQPIATWAQRFKGSIPDNISVVGGVNEETIYDAITDASTKSTFVIVDLEGSANVAAADAIRMADLVLIPLQGTQLDADQADRVVSFIERQSKGRAQRIEYRIMFSMVGIATSNEHKHIHQMLIDKGRPILPASLWKRSAFSLPFQVGGTIFDHSKKDVSKPDAAITNATQVAEAVANALRETKVQAA